MSKRPGDPGYSGTWCIHFRDALCNETCAAGGAQNTRLPKMVNATHRKSKR